MPSLGLLCQIAQLLDKLAMPKEAIPTTDTVNALLDEFHRRARTGERVGFEDE